MSKSSGNDFAKEQRSKSSQNERFNESTGLLSSQPNLKRSTSEYRSLGKDYGKTGSNTFGLGSHLNKINSDEFSNILRHQPSVSLLQMSQQSSSAIRSPRLDTSDDHFNNSGADTDNHGHYDGEDDYINYDNSHKSGFRPMLKKALTFTGWSNKANNHSSPPFSGSESSSTISSISRLNSSHHTNTHRHQHKPHINRHFYDDFTSVDWVNDTVEESKRLHSLKVIKGFKGRYLRLIDNLTGWLLITLIAFAFSIVAYVTDRSESVLVDLKRGYCQSNWLLNESRCCKAENGAFKFHINSPSFPNHPDNEVCTNWKLWPQVFDSSTTNMLKLDFLIYLISSIILAYISVRITLTTKTTNPLIHDDGSASNLNNKQKPPKVIYSAYGSGVPEVKTILSGFIIRKFLGTYTLLAKQTALIFAIGSGLCVGKEGPFVHLATCVGNILSRFFKKFKESGLERRQILSASASAGVALAFGSPLGGVLFSLEEVSYYLPGNQLFKTFFCAIMSILFLRFLNPYGTGKTVLFEINYSSDWKTFELVLFIIIGVSGGIFGGFFCKLCIWWSNWFRSKKLIKNHPIREVLLIVIVTSILSFSNPYTKTAIPELLNELASPCFNIDDLTNKDGICPIDFRTIPKEVKTLLFALVTKVLLTFITFGIKVPAGIYVPSMVIGALYGRIFSMVIEYCQLNYFPNRFCSNQQLTPCIDFGIYAMIGAGAFMAGVTRMNITLATIMFELTSSYTYVLPISLAIAVSNWVAYAIEPNSLYQLLLNKNEFPFFSNGKLHDFDSFTKVKDLIHGVDDSILIKLKASDENETSIGFLKLRRYLKDLQIQGLVDGSIPILDSNNRLIGMLPAPELEFNLDRLEKLCNEFEIKYEDISVKLIKDKDDEAENEEEEEQPIDTRIFSFNDEMSIRDFNINLLNEFTDFTKIVENTPIMLDIASPLSLAEIVFQKLGNRYICIFKNGEFVGVLYKKVFIDYCKTCKN